MEGSLTGLPFFFLSLVGDLMVMILGSRALQTALSWHGRISRGTSIQDSFWTERLTASSNLALWLNGPIRRLVSQMHVFAPGRKVDDAVTVLAEFANASRGTFEATRFATGNQNRNSLEINGSDGCLEFNLERMNHLAYNDLREDAALQGRREILVTGPGHPYVDCFWPPGHVIGYEHTFIATLVDFLVALAHGERFRPDFADALEVQRLERVR